MAAGLTLAAKKLREKNRKKTAGNRRKRRSGIKKGKR